MIKEKSIATCLLLTIFTCGIYGIIWIVTMTDDTNTVCEDNSISGGLTILLMLLTCGLYSIYWSYMMGKRLYDAKTKKGLNASDNSILYLILSLFSLNIVNYCLIQSELNDIANA